MISSLSANARRFGSQYLSQKHKDLVRQAIGSALSDRVVTYREAIDREDVRVWRFGEKRPFRLEEPFYYNSLPDEIERLVGSHVSSEPYVLEVPNVTVISGQGILRTADGKFLIHNHDRQSDEDAERRLGYDVLGSVIGGTWPFRVPRTVNRPCDRVDLAVPFVDRWAKNYYHWIADFLTKIEAIEYYTEQTGKQPTLLLPPDPPAFVLDSLELFGIDPERWTAVGDRPVAVDRLVLPSYRQSRIKVDGEYLRDPESFRWLRDQFRGVIEAPKQRVRRILVSRQQDASTRRITNWDEVRTELVDRGFEPIVKTEYSFIEQKQLFRDVDVVVAPHGAGLADLVFGEDTTVIELFGSYVVPTYYELCEDLGHRYGCLLCDPRGDDLHVDIDELTTAIDAMTASADT